jgi:hypothetical protein
MSNRTRYFVISAGAILAVGLTTGLVASYMGLPVAFSRAAGPDELQYVPADAAVVAYANVHELMTSSFRERFRKLEPATPERDEFEQKTGVNIDEDIQTVVAAMMPGTTNTDGTTTPKGMLVLARGRFEAARLEALAVEHGGKVEDYQGKRLLTHAKDGGDADMALGFIDADLVAMGNYQAVKRAIDAGAGGNNVVSNNELMRQVTELENSNVWAVGRFDALANTGKLPPAIQAQVPAIQWFSAAGHINGGVSGTFKAEARDDEAAKNLHDILNGVLAMARMQANTRPEFKTLVDSLQLTGDGRNVAVSFSIPTELLDALEAMAKQHGEMH